MGATDPEERTLLDLRFGSGSPTTWYIGLSTTTPNDDGSAFTEPSGGSYARVAVTNNSTNWPAAFTVGGITFKRNGTAITFPNPTGTWGTAVAWGAFTAASGGTPAYVNLLDTPVAIRSGNTPVEFAASALELVAD